MVVLETDKVSVDVGASGSGGVVGKILAQVDESVLVGAPLVEMLQAEAPAGYQAGGAAPTESAPVAAAAPVAASPSTLPLLLRRLLHPLPLWW